MRVTIFLTIVLSLLLAAGCGKSEKEQRSPDTPVGDDQADAAPARPEAPPDRWTPELGDRVAAMMGELMTAVDESAGDCSRTATAALAVTEARRELITEMMAADRSPAALEWKDRNTELLFQYNKRLMVIAGCSDAHPELVKLLQELTPRK